jgi:hypothetical protein
MNKTLLQFYRLEDKKTNEIVDLGIKESIKVKKYFNLNF